jgi:hypothetical protein
MLGPRTIHDYVRRPLSPELIRRAAQDWVASTDDPNARLIESTRTRADCIFEWPAA